MALPRILLKSFSPTTLRTTTTRGMKGPVVALLPIMVTTRRRGAPAMRVGGSERVAARGQARWRRQRREGRQRERRLRVGGSVLPPSQPTVSASAGRAGGGVACGQRADAPETADTRGAAVGITPTRAEVERDTTLCMVAGGGGEGSGGWMILLGGGRLRLRFGGGR